MIDQLDHIEERTATFAWTCPRCGAGMELSPPAATCPACASTFACEGGVWRFLPEERSAAHQTFLDRYAEVRKRERWGSNDPNYYRTLPDVPPNDPNRAIWRIRRRTCRHFERDVLLQLEARAQRPLKVADLGAGNGWLSYRLARRGHHVVAVDLKTDSSDGLGALQHYDVRVVGLQAEFDRLPFAPEQFDLAVFNGSLHYSADVSATLREALRVLAPDGRIVVLDSPIYRTHESGHAMVQEREAHFRDDFGLASESSNGQGFLTRAQLNETAAELGLEWTMLCPFYGWRWMARPLWHRLQGRREPATFGVIVFSRAATVRRHAATSRFLGPIRRQLAQLIRSIRPVPVVSPMEGYDRWAASYGEKMNPVQTLEADAIDRLLPEMEDLDVLDLGCGRGRLTRLALSRGAASVAAVDASPRMIGLAQAEISDPRVTWRQGDATRLSCQSGSVDVVVSGLMMGHVADLETTVAEIARVLRPGGTLVLSDFHPYATLSGAQRTFADGSARTYAIRHHLHLLEDYVRCFIRHGLVLTGLEEPRHDGTPIVFVMKAEKQA